MKQTEIGLIPDDWEVKELQEVCSLITKQTGFDYSATIRPALLTEPTKNTIAFIQNKDFEEEIINYNTDFFIPISIAKKFPRIYLNEDVLLISISGRIGNVAYFKHIKDAFIGGAVGIARFYDKDLINYCMRYLLSSNGQNQIFANEKSGAQHNLTVADVRKLQIPFPPKKEQQQITKALSDVDALISTTEKLIQKKKNIKQGSMQNLLTGKKRLPGFAKSTNYKQTELGPIPEDWEVKSLGDIAFVTKLAGFEFTAHVNYSEIGKIIALRGLNVKKGYLVLDDVKFIDNSNFSKLDRSKLYINDLLFTYVGTVGNVALVNKNDTYYLAPNVALIRGNKYVYSYFLMYLMLSQHFFDNQIQALMSTTSQAALSMTNIRLFKIPLPSIEEQTAIANVLSSMDKEIETLNTKLEKYRNLKTAMMQQLLTGKIRLR